jgi:D-alanine-D-alanine ligase
MNTTDRPLRLLYLVGSAVDDFHADLSRLYAGDCLKAQGESTHHLAAIAYISPGGKWGFPSELSSTAIAQARILSVAEALNHIHALGVDAVIPQMFCIPGMTTYRALFDRLGIPYLGNRSGVMAVGANKTMTRCTVAAAGVRVPSAQLLGPGERPALPYPVVVKPVDTDNSVGVSLARNPDEFDAAARLAFAHSGAALVETYVELGREVRCGIIVRDGQLVCLPLEEYAMDARSKPIRTRDDKLARTEDGDLYLVAKDRTKSWIVNEDDPITPAVWDVARRCHRALGCRHYSLFDFRIDPDGAPWFLEAGLYCSYSPSSVLAVMASARGIDVQELFEIGLAEMRREGAQCSMSRR